MPSTLRNSYSELISSLRDLEKVLGPATAAQYSPPPGGTGELAPNGIPNPTLDTVIDPRRMALSDAVKACAATLRESSRLLNQETEALSAALTRWEGHEGETTR
ncbi:DUF7169 domain-containing protein [Kribbella sp. CA-293567]|uniref:DUF7169 domain-containing protein n=1 Tax=Kribbella sp. CA-293567 TaxID=3002436 RepID=UPI003FA5534D